MRQSRREKRFEQTQDPSTVVVSRLVHPGREQDFDAWAREVDAAVRRFEGHLGNVRLQEAGGAVNYLIYRFDALEHLRAWEASTERQRLIARGDEISDQNRKTAVGMNAWFVVVGQPAFPKWKTFLVGWVAVYPILLLIMYALVALVPNLWRPIQLAISSVLLTSSLTWLVMPRLTSLLRPWLLRGVKRVDNRSP